MTNAEAWFSVASRPQKPYGSLGQKAQDGHFDFHTAPELCVALVLVSGLYTTAKFCSFLFHSFYFFNYYSCIDKLSRNDDNTSMSWPCMLFKDRQYRRG